MYLEAAFSPPSPNGSAPVAQLDRAPDFESVGRRFDSCRARHLVKGLPGFLRQPLSFGRATLQPGWKWSTSVKPLAKTKSCEAPHLQYHVSGRLHVVMDDGSEEEFGPYPGP